MLPTQAAPRRESAEVVEFIAHGDQEEDAPHRGRPHDPPGYNFPYPELLPTPKSFRLLRMKETSKEIGNSPIYFDLIAYGLDNCPRYSALSYTWGSPFDENDEDATGVEDWISACHEIIVNGESFPIPQNLFDGLHQLLRSGYDGYLWIDLLCISQKDMDERSAQVLLMSDIFGTACQVICWLGREDKHSGLAMELIRLLAPVISERVERLDFRTYAKCGLDSEEFLTAVQDTYPGVEISSPAPSVAHWQSFCHFDSRKWFRRIWMVQELSLAQQAQLWCGDQSLEWQAATMVADFLLKVPDLASCTTNYELNGLFPRPGDCVVSQYVLQLRLSPSTRNVLYEYFDNWYRAKTLRHIQHAMLLYAIEHTLEFKSTDVRDRIYALLGLVARISEEATEPIVQPNYDLENHNLSLQVSMAIAKNLPLLSFLSVAGFPKIDHTLPSWVLDIQSLAQAPRQGMSMKSRSYRAGLPPKGWSEQDGLRVIKSTQLTVMGARCGKVQAAAAVIPQKSSTAHERAHLDHLAGMCRLVSEVPEVYPHATSQDRIQAWWRTIQAGTHGPADRAPDEAGRWFRAWFYMRMAWGPMPPWDSPSFDKDDEWRTIRDFLLKNAGREDLPDWNEFEALFNRPEDEIGPEGDVPFERWNQETVYGGNRFRQGSVYGGRRLVRTKSGMLALAPGHIQVGDEIWILMDAKLPSVLRPDPGTEIFQLVGEVYVHGFSFGEAFDQGLKFEAVTLE